jgi:hypothetical protein
MDEIKTSAPESPALDAGKWIGRVVTGVILAEAIWGFIASLTNNLVLPLLARTMGGDAQSPLYLGKGDINVPALFASVLELCFAGIAAVILNSVVQRKAKVIRVKAVRVSPIPAQPASPPSSPPRAVAPVQELAPEPPPRPPVVTYAAPQPPVPPPAPLAPATTPEQFWQPEPVPQPKAVAPPPSKPPAKPTKPKAPKEVYYNIVGEPINPTEDD